MSHAECLNLQDSPASTVALKKDLLAVALGSTLLLAVDSAFSARRAAKCRSLVEGGIGDGGGRDGGGREEDCEDGGGELHGDGGVESLRFLCLICVIVGGF